VHYTVIYYRHLLLKFFFGWSDVEWVTKENVLVKNRTVLNCVHMYDI